MILTLARGHYCPKEHQQHLELAALLLRRSRWPTPRSSRSRPTTTTRLQEFRASVGAQWTFLSDPGRIVQQDLDIQEYTDPEHDPMIPHTLVLKPGLVDPQHLQRLLVLGPPVGLTTCGVTCARRPREIRPDWDLSTPGLREAWDAGDYSQFHGWDRRSPESTPSSYE